MDVDIGGVMMRKNAENNFDSERIEGIGSYATADLSLILISVFII